MPYKKSIQPVFKKTIACALCVLLSCTLKSSNNKVLTCIHNVISQQNVELNKIKTGLLHAHTLSELLIQINKEQQKISSAVIHKLFECCNQGHCNTEEIYQLQKEYDLWMAYLKKLEAGIIKIQEEYQTNKNLISDSLHEAEKALLIIQEDYGHIKELAELTNCNSE